MSDERPVEDQPPEEVGADTEKFRAFVRQGDETDRGQRPNSTARMVALAAGLLLLAAVVVVLVR